jgi:hypothetical protein
MAPGAIARTEKNSFLNRPVRNTVDLVNQLRKDPEVRDRYTRHFGKSVDQLASEFSQLHLARLAVAGDYLVYNVDDHGIVHSRMLHLFAGTPVFMDAQGNPVLKKSCGNAMKRGSDKQDAKQAIVVSEPVDLKDLSVLSEPEALPALVVEAEPGVSAVEVGQEAIPMIDNPPTHADIPIVGSGSGFSFPVILIAAGGSVFVGGGESSHSAVPEPASILGLSVGLLGVAGLIRRRGH